MLKDIRIRYQLAVKAARAAYFSDLIRNSQNPKTLFATINSFIRPPSSTSLDVSPTK
ncbi:hypothetical protein AAFF_G00395350 [Aldrovandia affinis]|uniref:Uncharacterized protein n=1 Tax=Aldrovandia affinis TaxID=143900 RepID=A0AAD7R4G5_9TELE|nr:hypothetical protein AAFF_G00395350 [Aldrovandia affinis]